MAIDIKPTLAVSELITDENWRLHPDWVYCQYNYAGDRAMEFDTPEETFRHFVAKSQGHNSTENIQAQSSQRYLG